MLLRWLTTLSLLIAVLLAGMTGWHAWESRRIDDQVMDRRLQRINRTFTPSLANATHAEDIAQVHELLSRLTRDPAIINATLRDARGEIRDFSGQAPPPLPSTLEIQTADESRRWIQPLKTPAGVPSAQRFWLDLSFDPRRAADTMERWPERLLPPISMLLLGLAGLTWLARRHQRQRTSGHASRVSAPELEGNLRHVSHELRAPLSGLLGFCRLLENSPLDAQQREWLRHIHLASNGLLDTVDQVLQDGRRESTIQVFDIAEQLWEILCLQSPLAQPKGITLLAIVYDDVPPRLVGPSIAVHQLFTNLINNAIKYGGPGDIVVRVVLEARNGDRVRLRLSVSNEGRGAPGDRERLRRALEDDDADGDNGNAGNGMGIRICRRLARELNGSLALAARSGKGSTVVANIELQAQAPFIRPAEFDLGGARIALWQPHTRLAHLLDHALERWGALPQRLAVPESLETLGPDDALAIIGIDHDDLEPAPAQRWQQRFDAMSHPCLLLVNIGPTRALAWRLPAGSKVLRLPMSRYMLGRTLVKMLVDRNTGNDRDQPRILVVDDNEISQHYLDALLSIIGATAITAGSAEEALDIAPDQRIDLVLMDLQLPDADGFEATERLRRLGGRWRHVPVVAMTAESDTHERPLPIDRGIDELLSKPLDERRLRMILSHYLPSRTHVADASPSLPASNGDNTSPHARAPYLSDLPVVDTALSARVNGGREALAAEMRTLLLAELPIHRRHLHTAWQRQDLKAIEEIAHRLGGGCRYCGVPQLSAACESLESACRSDPEACQASLHDLIAACDRLLAWAESRSMTETQ